MRGERNREEQGETTEPKERRDSDRWWKQRVGEMIKSVSRQRYSRSESARWLRANMENPGFWGCSASLLQLINCAFFYYKLMILI